MIEKIIGGFTFHNDKVLQSGVPGRNTARPPVNQLISPSGHPPDMSQKTYLVYILKNRMNRRFTGITGDAGAELRAHNKGRFRGTRQFKPWQMEWCSRPLSRNDSLRLEEQLRRHKTSVSMLESIIGKHDMGM